jgi:hypothetical protein
MKQDKTIFSKKLTFKDCAVVFFLLTVSFTASAASYVFRADFESGGLDKKGIKEAGGCYDHSFSIVNSPKLPGRKSLKVRLKGWEKNDPCKDHTVGKSRSEIRFAKDTPVGAFPEGKEFWIGWNMFFPKDFSNKSGRIIVSQIIESGPGPEMSFLAGDGKLEIERIWTEKTHKSSKDKKRDKIYKEKLPLDRWVNVVMNLKRSRKSDGFIKIWIDGKLVADVKGQNVIRDAYARHVKGPYFKTGAYFGPEKRKTEYVVYFDEVRIATGNANYKTVAIGDGPTPTRPKVPTGLTIKKWTSK